MGSGEPLLLLHGVMGSEWMWQGVAPLLASDCEVIAPTALGHNGGPPALTRPASFREVIATCERQMDDLSLHRAHLVGNSMGGWMALELARAGRARSVLAISPAGMWVPTRSGGRPRAAKLTEALRMGRLTRPALPLFYRSARVRQFALRNVAARGVAVSRRELLRLTDDMLGCTIAEDLLAADEYFTPLDPAPCPITIAWCERDRIFPEPIYGVWARERVPGARYVVLRHVGHVPMLDDPQLVADTVRDALGASARDPTPAEGVDALEAPSHTPT
jgi:pimeloyl-ACP methyl ester carboxylesterase